MSAVAATTLGLEQRRKRATLVTAGLSLVLVISLVLGVAWGAVGIDPGSVGRIMAYRLFGIGTPDWPAVREAIVWDIRFPRVLLGAFVGAGLAITGMTLQAMVRNMLADPYLLGVNSGASCGAAAAILFGVGAAFGHYALPASAFLGALAASLLVFITARTGGRVTSVRLLLAGVTVGYALYAATSFLIFASGSAEGSRSVLFWLLGSLTLARWDATIVIVAVTVLITIAILTLAGRHLDALAIGDETAHTLGLSPDRFRLLLLTVVALCIGVLVSASGSIGFVGLVVPHLARRLVGTSHRRTVPVAALLGAVLLIWADIAARVILRPEEIPLGIVTSLVGAPFLLILIRRMYADAR